MSNPKPLIAIDVLLTALMATTLVSPVIETDYTQPFVIVPRLVEYKPLSMALHVDGNKIKNASNETVYLRGFNVVGSFHAAASGAWNAWDYYDSSVVDDFFAAAAAQGVNCIREMTNAVSWVDDSAVNSDISGLTVRSMYKDFVSRAASNNIYVILNDYTVTLTDIDIDYVGYPPYASANERTTFPTRADYVDYIVARTCEFSSYPNYIADFWNEPYWMNTTAVAEYQTTWQQIINGVRNGGFTGLILAQYSYSLTDAWGIPTSSGMNLNWYYDYPLTDSADNLAVGFHLYRESLSGQSTVVDLKNLFSNVFHIDDIASDLPMICEEIGARSSDGQDTVFLMNSLSIFNEWGIGYLAWVLNSSGTTYDMLTSGTDKDDFNLNSYGQIVVDAIADAEETEDTGGEPPLPPPPAQYYYVNVSGAGNVQVHPEGSHVVTYPQPFWCIATPDVDYEFSYWKQNGIQVSTNTNYTIDPEPNMTYNMVAYATANPPTEPDQPDAPAPEYYSVNIGSSTGVTTDLTGTQTLLLGQQLTVNATTKENYRFNYWLYDNSAEQNGDKSFTVTETSTGQHTLLPVVQYITPPSPNMPQMPSGQNVVLFTPNRQLQRIMRQATKIDTAIKIADIQKVLRRLNV